MQLDCDERCTELQDKKMKDKQTQEENEKSELLKQQQEEMEKFERKKQGRKRKQRQLSEESEGDKTFFQIYRLWFFMLFLVIVMSCFTMKIIFLDS